MGPAQESSVEKKKSQLNIWRIKSTVLGCHVNNVRGELVCISVTPTLSPSTPLNFVCLLRSLIWKEMYAYLSWLSLISNILGPAFYEETELRKLLKCLCIYPIDHYQYRCRSTCCHWISRWTYIHNNPVCVCVYVRKAAEAGSLVVLSTRQYRLLLNKYSLSMGLLGNSTLG